MAHDIETNNAIVEGLQNDVASHYFQMTIA